MLNVFYTISKLHDILQSGYYQSPLGYNNVDWFVDQVIRLEIKIAFLKNSKKDTVMTEEDEEVLRIKNICRFCEKNIESDKVRHHCHLTDNNRVPVLNTFNVNVKQKDSIFNHLYFIIFVTTIAIYFFMS